MNISGTSINQNQRDRRKVLNLGSFWAVGINFSDQFEFRLMVNERSVFFEIILPHSILHIYRNLSNSEFWIMKNWNFPKGPAYMHITLTVLNPRYITRISCRVNFVWRHRSSRATVTGFGTRVVSNSYTTSSIGLSGGVAIFNLLLR